MELLLVGLLGFGILGLVMGSDGGDDSTAVDDSVPTDDGTTVGEDTPVGEDTTVEIPSAPQTGVDAAVAISTDGGASFAEAEIDPDSPYGDNVFFDEAGDEIYVLSNNGSDPLFLVGDASGSSLDTVFVEDFGDHTVLMLDDSNADGDEVHLHVPDYRFDADATDPAVHPYVDPHVMLQLDQNDLLTVDLSDMPEGTELVTVFRADDVDRDPLHGNANPGFYTYHLDLYALSQEALDDPADSFGPGGDWNLLTSVRLGYLETEAPTLEQIGALTPAQIILSEAPAATFFESFDSTAGTVLQTADDADLFDPWAAGELDPWFAEVTNQLLADDLLTINA